MTSTKNPLQESEIPLSLVGKELLSPPTPDVIVKAFIDSMVDKLRDDLPVYIIQSPDDPTNHHLSRCTADYKGQHKEVVCLSVFITLEEVKDYISYFELPGKIQATTLAKSIRLASEKPSADGVVILAKLPEDIITPNNTKFIPIAFYI